MNADFLTHLEGVLGEIEASGLYKREREIAGPQGGRITVRTETGEAFSAPILVNAAGAWADQLLRPLGVDLAAAAGYAGRASHERPIATGHSVNTVIGAPTVVLVTSTALCA